MTAAGSSGPAKGARLAPFFLCPAAAKNRILPLDTLLFSIYNGNRYPVRILTVSIKKEAIMRIFRLTAAALCLCLLLASCGAATHDEAESSPESTSAETVTDSETANESAGDDLRSFKLAGSEYKLALPESARLEYADGAVTLTLPNGAGDVDLTPLASLDGLSSVSVNSPGGAIGSLKLPGCASAGVDAAALGRIEAPEGLELLEFNGELGSAKLPASLRSLICSGCDLSVFASLVALESLTVSRGADLAPLRDYAALKSLTVMRTNEDEPFDLSVLKDVTVNVLRLGGEVSASELESAAGAEFRSLQLSDEVFDDLSVLDEFKVLNTLMLTVSDDQSEELRPFLGASALTPEHIALLNTPIPKDQLIAFSERGDVYAFPEAGRIG